MDKSFISNTKPLKTTRSIVNDLRSCDKLDEEKWRKAKISSIKHAIFCAIFFIASLLLLLNALFVRSSGGGLPDGLFGFIGLVFILIECPKNFRNERKQFRLYTNGTSSYGMVTNIKSYFGWIVARGWRIWIQYTDNNGEDQSGYSHFKWQPLGLEGIVIKQPTLIQSAAHEWHSLSGEEVKILYNSNKTDEVTIFCEEKEKKYNLRRESRHE